METAINQIAGVFTIQCNDYISVINIYHLFSANLGKLSNKRII